MTPNLRCHHDMTGTDVASSPKQPSPKQRWRESFADPGGEASAAIVSADVELGGSALARPVHGKHAFWTALRTARNCLRQPSLHHHAVTDGRVYPEWTATALGMQIDGVTVLVLDGQGPFARAAVYHRPLAPVLAFSAEMARRWATSPGACHFYQVPYQQVIPDDRSHNWRPGARAGRSCPR